ncbi:MAG TPA: GNAT family N-acetyltransferase [Flavisolibacter sp.]|nr:GNAT family N-acetyltransferase [Flavisolibacter sp.]
MRFREANISDIKQMQVVRHSVKENILSDPSLVTDADVHDYITRRGKGWVCEVDGTVIGFAIADLEENNIWALFIHPDEEGQGIGKRLHQMMMNWYFSKTTKRVWLSTAADSRAEKFYRKAGWQETGLHGKGEIKFEMSSEQWNAMQRPDL